MDLDTTLFPMIQILVFIIFVTFQEVVTFLRDFNGDIELGLENVQVGVFVLV